MVISQPPPMSGGLSHPPPMMGGGMHKQNMHGGHSMHGGQSSHGGGQGAPILGPDGTIIDFDGKRLRKTMMRKTIDYSSSFLNMIQDRVWQRDYRDR